MTVDWSGKAPRAPLQQIRGDQYMQNQATRDIFITGLRNAHALEKEATQLIERQLDRLENYPQVADRLRIHLDETNRQIVRLDEIFDELGESHSTLKDTVMGLMGNMAALGHTMADDEILKNSFASFAFENFEIASYRALIVMAEAGAFAGAVPLLTETLREEQAMATWLEDHLPEVVTTYLRLSQMDVDASR